MNVIFGAFSSILVLIGFYALGVWFTKLLKLNIPDAHGKLAVGLGLFQLLFVGLSVVFNPQTTQSIILGTLLLAVFLNYIIIWQLVQRLPSLINWSSIVLLVLLIPYIFRMISPPTSSDGLSFYLPSIEWIYHNGLAFNPYLTRYTTMPSGVEHLFSIGYGLGDFVNVRVLDGLISILFIHAFYSFCRRLLSKNFARIAVLIALLVPGTFMFLFGTGKIDTVNNYLIFIGLIYLVKSWKSSNLAVPILLLSFALGTKYTSWILLFLPLLVLGIKQLSISFKLKNLFIALIPLLFIAPTMIRNQINTNNPFAPITSSASQTKFIANHGNLPTQTINTPEVTILNKEIKVPFQFTTFHLALFVFVFWMGMAMLIYFNKINFPDFWILSAFLILSLLPWFYFLGFNNQPTRFIWVQILVMILITIKCGEEVFKSRKVNNTGAFPKVLVGVVLIATLSKVYIRHRSYISDFFTSTEMELVNWYNKVGKDHYAFTTEFSKSNYQSKNVLYYKPMALGLIDLKDYGNMPTEELFYFIQNTQISPIHFDYAVGQISDFKEFNLDYSQIVIQEGSYYLIKIKK